MSTGDVNQVTLTNTPSLTRWVFFRLAPDSIPGIVLHPPLHRKSEVQIKKPRATNLVAAGLVPIKLVSWLLNLGSNQGPTD